MRGKKIVAEVVNRPGKIKLLCSSFFGNKIVFTLIDGRRIAARVNRLSIVIEKTEKSSYEKWKFGGVSRNGEFSGHYESHRDKMFLHFNL